MCLSGITYLRATKRNMQIEMRWVSSAIIIIIFIIIIIIISVYQIAIDGQPF